MAGFFFKNWSYPIAGPEGKGKRLQSAPMLIGRSPIWNTGASRTSNHYAGAIAGGLFVAALFGVWIGVWRIGRSDKQFRRRTIDRSFALEEGVSLNDLDLDVTDDPDFRNLK